MAYIMDFKKKLGQNFLQDRNILWKEAKLVVSAGKVILEIGSGDGRLTEQILAAGASKIYAVEKDSELAAVLKDKFKNEARVKVLTIDFLELTFPGDVEVAAGNIPYYISSDIIFSLKGKGIKQAVLIVQKEFAEKMIAKPRASNYGRLSVTSQIFFNIELIQKVPAHLFVPRPKVDSMLIMLKPTNEQLSKAQEDVIRRIFQQKNRKIRNSFPSAPAEFLEKRPRELSPEDVLKLVKGTI
jgi:ribosomal RNA small subunit methyltransferase A